jgi:hypothetical protein
MSQEQKKDNSKLMTHFIPVPEEQLPNFIDAS